MEFIYCWHETQKVYLDWISLSPNIRVELFVHRERKTLIPSWNKMTHVLGKCENVNEIGGQGHHSELSQFHDMH